MLLALSESVSEANIECISSNQHKKMNLGQ
jgi:hypothetical protein